MRPIPVKINGMTSSTNVPDKTQAVYLYKLARNNDSPNVFFSFNGFAKINKILATNPCYRSGFSNERSTGQTEAPWGTT